MYIGVHWGWESLKYLFPNVCEFVTLSVHAVNGNELFHRSQFESLFKSSNNFLEVNLDGDDLDDNYFRFD